MRLKKQVFEFETAFMGDQNLYEHHKTDRYYLLIINH